MIFSGSIGAVPERRKESLAGGDSTQPNAAFGWQAPLDEPGAYRANAVTDQTRLLDDIRASGRVHAGTSQSSSWGRAVRPDVGVRAERQEWDMAPLPDGANGFR